jgi:tetratricopeptide (TPR) repeat protein
MSIIDISKKGREKFRSRKFLEACALFSNGLQREPDNPYLLSGMGDACREAGNFIDAERCYRRLLEVDRNNLFALRGLGDVCKKQGRHQEAVRYWQQYLVLRPRDKHVMTRIADSCKALMQFEQAEETYKQILKFEPQERFALTGIADLQHRLGRDDEAIRYYEKVLEFDHNELHILTIIGKLCWRVNDFDKAEKYFQRALTIDPKNPYALYGLGNCYRWHRQYQQTIDVWNEILEFSEGNKTLHSRMGDVYLHLGQPDAAEKSYQIALSQGYDRFAMVGLVRLYCERDEWQKAADVFWSLVAKEEAVDLQLEELSKRFVRSGQRELMLAFFHQLLVAESGEAAVRDEIRALLQKIQTSD